jgi:putative tryptophan/tyrosine transport system substrate-binding protein
VTIDATKQGNQMNRRELVTLVGGLAAAPSMLRTRAARAQEARRTYRLGAVHTSPLDAPHQVAFFDQLRQLGFIEGQNLTADRRGYGLRAEQFDEHAAELVKSQVDVIMAGGDAAVSAAQRATTVIPILALTDDMLGNGFVRSLAKPGGNTTGVSILASELDGKRQDIIMEAAPGLRHIAALADRGTSAPPKLQALQDAARARGVELSVHWIARPEEIAPAIEAAKASGAGALNVLASSLLFNNRTIILDRVAALRLPAVYQWPEMAEEGGLLGYGPRIVQLYRDVLARQLVALLRGAKPADVPVELPTKFELVVNLQAARAIGHEVPVGFLLRADKVVE